MSLLFYFIKNLYKKFIFLFCLLTLIFASGDLIARLPVVPNFKSASWLFVCMLPLISSLSIPITCCLSIQMLIGSFFSSDSILFLHFNRKAKRSLFFSISIFAVSVFFLYVPLVTHFAPKSYKIGKNFILNFAKKQFDQLTPGKMHNLYSGINLFFEKKINSANQEQLKNIFIMFNEKAKSEKYVVTAGNGVMKNEKFILKNGLVQNIADHNGFISSAEQIDIDLKKLFEEKSVLLKKQLKFSTLGELYKKAAKNKNSQGIWIEIYKRFSQIFWLLIMALMSFLLIFTFAKPKNNLLLSILLTGMLFFTFYFSINLSQFLFGFYNFGLIILYLFPILLVLFFYHFYKKKYLL